MTKKALITGITGQDGSYLAELLLAKGYEVHGIVRRASSFNTHRIEHLIEGVEFGKTFFYHWGDLSDACNLDAIVKKVVPDEVYNLAAQSHVKVSFDVPEYTAIVDAVGTLRMIEAIRNYAPEARFYEAATSEMFGGIQANMPEEGFNETSPFHPRSPYGVAKVYGYWIVRNYREAYGLHLSNGILFNHESPRRGETFVTRKITRWCGEHYHRLRGEVEGEFSPLRLGNLHAVRDWAHAKDYVEAQWLMLQQPEPDDYVVATGETRTVRQFVEACFAWMDLPLDWEGGGLGQKARTTINGRSEIVVVVDPRYFRPTEVEYLKGDSRKIRSLGWEPRHDFEALVDDMMRSDCLVHEKVAGGA